MSYVRPGMSGMGDPVTSPSQTPTESITVGEIYPKRVECSELSADSPWRQPGQVCGPAGGGILDILGVELNKVFGPSPASASTGPSLKSGLIVGGLLAGAYFFFSKRGR